MLRHHPIQVISYFTIRAVPEYSCSQQYLASLLNAIEIEVQEGVIVIFPSWLKHGVAPNLSDRDRISLSFNYIFLRPLC